MTKEEAIRFIDFNENGRDEYRVYKVLEDVRYG